MKRIFFAAIAISCGLGVASSAGEPQKRTSRRPDPEKLNRVYVKIILPVDSATRGKDQPAVESWIAEHLKKQGQTKFTGATEWLPVTLNAEKSQMVWNGWLDGQPWGTVAAKLTERAGGRIKLLFDGFGPCRGKVTVSLTDEPGSREIGAVEDAETKQGPPYVAVIVGPPVEKAAASTDQK